LLGYERGGVCATDRCSDLPDCQHQLRLGRGGWSRWRGPRNRGAARNL